MILAGGGKVTGKFSPQRKAESGALAGPVRAGWSNERAADTWPMRLSAGTPAAEVAGAVPGAPISVNFRLNR
jgi:hypothetical protein